MKKKLLLFIAVIASLMCLLAISSSAATRKDLSGVDREITVYDDAPAKTNIKTSIDDVVIFDDGFCCPSAYIFKDEKSIADGSAWKMALPGLLDFEFLEKKGKNYTADNVVELDIPEGVTRIPSYFGYFNAVLKRVTIPYSVESLGNCIFEEASGLQYCIFEKGGNPNIKTLGGYSFASCKNLQSFSMPDSITKIAGDRAFGACSNLKALHLSNSLEIIEGGSQNKATFDGANKMYFVNEFFDGNTIPAKPEVYYFPESLTTMSNTCIFRWCHNLNNVLVFGKNITEVPNLYTFENESKNTIVFLGNMTNVDISKWGTTTVYFANQNDKSLSDIETFNNSTDKPKTVYFCNADGNTNHLVSDKKDVLSEATCVDYAVYATKCYCGKTLGNVNGTELNPDNHDYESTNSTLVSIVYVKYNENGTKTVTCGHGCDVNGTKTVNPIFVAKGYSIKTDGRGITTDYELNIDALNEYVTYLNGKSFEFGIFIGNSETFGETFIKDNGSIDNDYAFSQKVTADDFIRIKCTVADFTTAEADLELVMGLYVIDDGKVSYIQHEGTYEDTVTKGDATLDVVTIKNIATLSNIDLVLPEPKALPVENKEN